MYMIASILLIFWSLLGSFDSTFYHDKKYALYLHSSSIKEHLYHTIRSICYPIIIFSLFYENFFGILFWIGIIAIIIDTIFFILDVFEEKNSRNKWGGLSHGESIIHLFSNTFHYCAITIMLVSKTYLPPSTNYPQYLSLISIILITGGTITAMQHIWRLFKFKTNTL